MHGSMSAAGGNQTSRLRRAAQAPPAGPTSTTATLDGRRTSAYEYDVLRRHDPDPWAALQPPKERDRWAVSARDPELDRTSTSEPAREAEDPADRSRLREAVEWITVSDLGTWLWIVFATAFGAAVLGEILGLWTLPRWVYDWFGDGGG